MAAKLEAESNSHALQHELLVRPAGHRLENHPDRSVADVGVVAMGAGCEPRLRIGEGEHVVVRCRREVRAFDHPGAVREQVVQRDGAEPAARREPRDVFGHRGIEVKQALLDQL